MVKKVDYHGLVAEGAILVDVRTPKDLLVAAFRGHVSYEEAAPELDAFGT